VKSRFENNWGAANEATELVVEDLKGITTLDEVLVGTESLVIDQDVFLMDAEKGTIKFATAPKDAVEIRFHKVENPYMKVIAGTEKVTVNGEVWERSTIASNDNKKYQINYR